MNKPPSTHFVLLIDKERELLLNIAFQSLVSQPNFASTMHHHGLAEVIDDFLEEMAIKSHELGFCDDPECEDKKHKE
jgi:hypothetical protein